MIRNKIISFVVLLLASLSGMSQTITQNLGSPNTLVNNKGFFKSDSTGTLLSLITKRAKFAYDTSVKISGIADSIKNFGNSFTVGVGATPNTLGYAYLMDAYYSLLYSNLGLSGSGVWIAATRHYSNIQPGHNSISTVMSGFNNIRKNGNTLLTTRKVTNEHVAIFVNQMMKNYSVANSGLGVTLFGTWSAYNSTGFGGKTGANGATTSTLNDSLTFTFTDTTVAFGGFGSDSSSSPFYFSENFQVLIDNVLVGTYTENNQTDGIDPSGDSYNNRIIPMAWYFTGLTNTAHTLKIVNKTTHSYPLNIDFVGNLVDATKAMPLLIFEIPKMNAAGYAIAGFNSASNAIMDAINFSLDSTIALFPRNYPVYVAKTNNYYNTLTDVSGDNIHPTNLGHFHIGQAGQAALPIQNSMGVGFGILAAGTAIYANGIRPVFSDTTGYHQFAYVDDISKGKIPLIAAGPPNSIQYSHVGSMAGYGGTLIDTIEHGIQIIAAAISAGAQNNLTGLYVLDTVRSPVSGFRWSPSMTLQGTGYNSTTALSNTFAYTQYVQTQTGPTATIHANWRLDYQNNSLTNIPALSYQPGLGFGVNTAPSGIAGAVDAYEIVSPNYGLLARLSTGAHFTNIGALNTTTGALAFDATLGSANAMTFDGTGSFTSPATITSNISVTKISKINAAQTTVLGAIGSAIFSQPEQGPSYKRVIIFCNNETGAVSYTFPTAFVNTPVIITTNGLAAALVTSLSTTAVTVTGSASTGPLIIEGY